MIQENLQVNSAAVSDRGLSEKRPQNEDSYLELRDSGLFAVADGVGGAQAGDVASQMAMEILGEAFINLQEDGDAEERMKAAIQQANSAIYQTSNELAQLSTMATTIVALHIHGNIATIGHVGDSRLYRLDENGNLFRETQDHSVVEEEVRAGRMTPEQALNHPSRNVISRALGAEQNVEIDLKTIMFEPNTKFLICSDGVTRHIPDEELGTLLRSSNDNFELCQTIKQICYERGAEDNLTAVIISVGASAEEMLAATASESRAEFEEETVATARLPLANSAVLGNTSGSFDNSVTQQYTASELQDLPVEFADDQNDAENEDIVIPMADSQSNTISIPTQEENAQIEDVESYRITEKSGRGILGRIISGILWLLIGAILGALGYWFWANNFAPKTAEVSKLDEQMVAFEKQKRAVDRDPTQYIQTNQNPATPTEHYLSGRANYLLGKTNKSEGRGDEAKGNFDIANTELKTAREKLIEIDEVNRKSVEIDIANLLENIDNEVNNVETPSNSGVENKVDVETETLKNTNAAGGQQTEAKPANSN